MIFERIYNGESAKTIGMTEYQYESRKKIVDEFILSNGPPKDFKKEFLEWGGRRETTIKEKILSAKESIGNIYRTRGKKVDPETYKKRIDICNGCGYLNPISKVCKLCWCRMTVKAAFAGVSCINGKWN